MLLYKVKLKQLNICAFTSAFLIGTMICYYVKSKSKVSKCLTIQRKRYSAS